MITIRDATPEERALILGSMPPDNFVIPPDRHLTDREVAYFCGVPWERIMRYRLNSVLDRLFGYLGREDEHA